MKTVRKEEKARMVADLHDRFDRAKATILTQYQGLTVEQMEALRRHLRASGVEFRVVKNTLAVKAVEGTDAAQLSGRFEGPIGVAWGYGDPVVPIKALADYAKKQDKFQICFGVLEGKALGPAELKEVAQLPGREVMLGKLLGSMRSPLYGLAGSLQGIQRKLVYALNAVKATKSE
ncbi:MAG: 50S ribosomal protein L10 [Nitrospirae bacterium]|nr:50S ribosomal protein L10 [Nitrospirota bacterium]